MRVCLLLLVAAVIVAGVVSTHTFLFACLVCFDCIVFWHIQNLQILKLVFKCSTLPASVYKYLEKHILCEPHFGWIHILLCAKYY